MNKLFILLVISLVSVSCASIPPARYLVNQETRQVLRQFSGNEAAMVAISAPPTFDAQCRGVGKITVEDGTITDFIMKAFNDELKYAGMYDPVEGIKLIGRIDRLEFSSSSNMTSGWWKIAITVRNEAGVTVTREITSEFESAFEALAACNRTAQALTTAAGELVRAVYTSDEFKKMLQQ